MPFAQAGSFDINTRINRRHAVLQHSLLAQSDNMPFVRSHFRVGPAAVNAPEQSLLISETTGDNACRSCAIFAGNTRTAGLSAVARSSLKCRHTALLLFYWTKWKKERLFPRHPLTPRFSLSQYRVRLRAFSPLEQSFITPKVSFTGNKAKRRHM